MSKTYAAIDIGSNAIRLLIASRVELGGKPEIVESIRLPIRLGVDAFGKGILGKPLAAEVVEAFQFFRRVTDSFGVDLPTALRAVATSAMREAVNAAEVIQRVAETSGIQIEVITGDEEARLIQLAVNASLPLIDHRAMLIDIGGGSVEVTISDHGQRAVTETFPLGTVRLLRVLAENGEWQRPALIESYAAPILDPLQHIFSAGRIQLCAGTGGNIEALGELAKRLYKTDTNRAIHLDHLSRLIDLLASYSPAQRVKKLDLRSDRADVILPAAVVLHQVARLAGVELILIPNVGLKDGVLLDLMDLQQSALPNQARRKKE